MATETSLQRPTDATAFPIRYHPGSALTGGETPGAEPHLGKSQQLYGQSLPNAVMEDLVGALMAQGDFPEVLNRPSWQYRAACRGRGTQDYFTYRSDVRAAKAIFARCPVQAECLAVALDDPGLVGVWGGTTIFERRAIRRVRLDEASGEAGASPRRTRAHRSRTAAARGEGLRN